MRIVPVYGSISSISANNVGIIAQFKVPTGYYAEVPEIGVIPDLDPTTSASNLLGVYIAHSSEEDVVGSAFLHSNISANHNGKNAAPYGDRACRQPPLLIDTPLIPGNLTYKFAPGKVIQLIGKAGTSATGTVRGRLKVILLTPEEVRAIYGVPADEFTSLPGGYDQKKPVLPYFEYFYNASATSGGGVFETIKSISVQDFEEIRIREIGFAPHTNSSQFKIYDERLNKYFPSLDNYPLRVTEEENMLPFGDDEDYQPRQVVPQDLLEHIFTNTTIQFQVKDNGTAIPANGVCVQLVGEYRIKR